MLLDNLLDLLLLEVVELVLLQEQLHLGTSAQGSTLGIGSDGESTTGSRLPNVLLVIIVLGGDLNLLGDEVRRVETDTELTDHADIGTAAQGLHERLGSGLGDCSQVVDQVGLGHTDTGVSDGQALVLLVGGDSDVKLLLAVEDRLVGERLVSNLVEGIKRVGLSKYGKDSRSANIQKVIHMESRNTYDQLSQEDFLVRVEGVDDQVHQLADLGLEAVSSPPHKTNLAISHHRQPQRPNLAYSPKGLGLRRHLDSICFFWLGFVKTSKVADDSRKFVIVSESGVSRGKGARSKASDYIVDQLRWRGRGGKRGRRGIELTIYG